MGEGEGKEGQEMVLVGTMSWFIHAFSQATRYRWGRRRGRKGRRWFCWGLCLGLFTPSVRLPGIDGGGGREGGRKGRRWFWLGLCLGLFMPSVRLPGIDGEGEEGGRAGDGSGWDYVLVYSCLQSGYQV